MSPERARLARTALAAAALVVLDVAGTRLFDAFTLGERLFAGGTSGVVVAAATALLIFSRFMLHFVLPGYLLAAFAFWIVSQRKRRALRKCAWGFANDNVGGPR